MSTRTLEELTEAVIQASAVNDAVAMLQCAEELEALGTPQAIADAAHARGTVQLLRANYPQALEHYHRALTKYEALGNFDRAALVTGNIGSVHYSMGNYAEALEYYNDALTVHEKLDQKAAAAGVIGNIGGLNWSLGNFTEALERFHLALAIHEQLGNLSGMATVTCNIGNTHSSTGNYPAALEQYHRACSLCEELDDNRTIARITGNIGIVYDAMGDYPAALEFFHRSLAIHEEYHNKNGIAIITANIGTIHTNTGNYTGALLHFQRALDIHEQLGFRRGIEHVTACIMHAMIQSSMFAEAEELLHTMDAMQIDHQDIVIQRELCRASIQAHHGNVDEAKTSLLAALAIAINHNLPSKEAEIHKRLRDLCIKNNDLAGYIEHNNEYTRITEEINGKETATKLAIQTKQREIDAREKEHAKHMAVLHSALPKHIADRVARGETVNDHHNSAAVLFLDVVGFTTNSSRLEPRVVVDLLQNIFTMFDAICIEHDVMKIKTIGDSYMAVAFPAETQYCEHRVACLAQAMMASTFSWPDGERLQFRIGLHTGPVVAGVLGTQRLQYDVWGDTVNVASRMESTSEPGRIHISEAFAHAVQQTTTDAPYSIVERGTVEIKGKGKMTTYWLEQP
jgi:adenylate cyclase